jgi:hypothetical protein
LVNVPLWASAFVTTTLTIPAACTGVVAVIDVLFTIVTLVAGVPPKLTVAPDRKPVPVRVTAVPPIVVPELGVIEVKVGAGLDEGVGGFVVVRPPPQAVNRSARKTARTLRGNKYKRDMTGSLSRAQNGKLVSFGQAEWVMSQSPVTDPKEQSPGLR